MNFEHLLYIYWSKGFFYNKKLNTFNINLTNLIKKINNFSFFNKFKFIKRFELTHFTFFKKKTFLELNLNIRKSINTYFSKIFNINFFFKDLIKYNLIRLYLIKAFNGICEFLGKPVNGQRTWSNKKNAKKLNKIVKFFIFFIKKKLNLSTKIVIKNKKYLQKKKKKKFLKFIL